MNSEISPDFLNHPSFFSTDLYMPQYPIGKWGQWEIRKVGICHDHGYHTGVWFVKDLPVLIKHFQDKSKSPETWMSLTPHEIESQELGCRYAKGHTVIMGLGLGWATINVALNPNVSLVTVIELDPNVIQLIQSTQIIAKALEYARNKVNIIEANALEWKPDQKVDFLYADIWQSLADIQTLEQVQQMQNHIQAETIYFWGQELFLYDAIKEDYEKNVDSLNNQTIKSAIKQLRLPLFTPQDLDYASMIKKIINNRINRRLPLLR